MTRTLTLNRTTARPRRIGLISLVLSLIAVRNQRLKLADLDDTMLRDIGLTRAEAKREAERPVWDCPLHSRQ